MIPKLLALCFVLSTVLVIPLPDLVSADDDRPNIILCMVVNNNEVELYDVITDPRETKNLYKSKPQIAGKMLARLKVWQKSCKHSDAGNDYD